MSVADQAVVASCSIITSALLSTGAIDNGVRGDVPPPLVLPLRLPPARLPAPRFADAARSVRITLACYARYVAVADTLVTPRGYAFRPTLWKIPRKYIDGQLGVALGHIITIIGRTLNRT